MVALSAGTAALHLGLILLGVQAGDEVICQSFTFCASANPVTYLGATAVFVDSEEDTWNMNPVLLEEAIRDRIAKTGREPKAIIPVHLYGMPAKMDEICAVAEKYGFKDQLAEDTYIFLAKEIQKLVGNKSKYTDWTNRQDVKDELYVDVAKLLKKHGYPPRTIDDAYDEIMKQVDNYKQYAD